MTQLGGGIAMPPEMMQQMMAAEQQKMIVMEHHMATSRAILAELIAKHTVNELDGQHGQAIMKTCNSIATKVAAVHLAFYFPNLKTIKSPTPTNNTETKSPIITE